MRASRRSGARCRRRYSDAVPVGGAHHAHAVANVAAAPAGAASPDADRIEPGAVMALVAMGLGVLVIANDFTALNVALPAIEKDFNVDVGTVQWVINAYCLVFGMAIVTGGRLADMFDRRRAFFVGSVIFAGFSLLGGLAQDTLWLIGARVGMGIGGALMWPAILGMTYAALPESKAGLAGGLILGAAPPAPRCVRPGRGLGIRGSPGDRDAGRRRPPRRRVHPHRAADEGERPDTERRDSQPRVPLRLHRGAPDVGSLLRHGALRAAVHGEDPQLLRVEGGGRHGADAGQFRGCGLHSRPALRAVRRQADGHAGGGCF